MTPLEQQLMEAARGEQVPEALSAKMATALQAGATASATATGASVAKLGAPLFAKAGLWGALSLGLIATASWYATRPAPASHSVSPAAPAAAAPELAQARATADPREATSAAALPDGARIDDVAGSAAEEQAASALDDGALRAEVALLARARAALRAQAPARAVRLLDRHARRFAHGTLVPEAAALRIEALIQQGAYPQAEAEIERFVTTYPAHPLRARVTELTRARAAATPR
jgi:hypothetical protein